MRLRSTESLSTLFNLSALHLQHYLAGKLARCVLRGRGGSDVALLPDCHPIPKCLAWVSCNLARRRYIPFPKLLKVKVNEF